MLWSINDCSSDFDPVLAKTIVPTIVTFSANWDSDSIADEQESNTMMSIKHTAAFDICQPIDDLFPLFSPEGEKLWVPGWDYENIMGTTDLCEDYVFLTKHHDHASGDAIWLVKRYQPTAYYVQFYKVEPEDKVGIVTVQCSKRSDRLTNVEVTYEYIGLSEKGERFISGFKKDEYENFIAEWKQLLIRYFN